MSLPPYMLGGVGGGGGGQQQPPPPNPQQQFIGVQMPIGLQPPQFIINQIPNVNPYGNMPNFAATGQPQQVILNLPGQNQHNRRKKLK